MEVSAGVIVRDDSGPEVVYLCVRAYSNWDFPKGHVEQGETLLQAAVRELHEETTLSVTDVNILGVMAPPVLYKNGKKTAHYFLADRKSDKEPFLPVNPDLGHPENDEYSWLTMEIMRSIFPARLLIVLDWIDTNT
tara:strand:+ start:236 stop:643 length:408 start_codon:yes stop_codon:yes gene_type:complete